MRNPIRNYVCLLVVQRHLEFSFLYLIGSQNSGNVRDLYKVQMRVE